jgi:tetratricopeptide (TPR) repeat protein
MPHLFETGISTLPRRLAFMSVGWLALIAPGPLASFGAQDAPGEAGAQAEIHSITSAEYDAFESARSEPDPERRAARLFEFIQKHPESPLIKQIRNEDYEGVERIEQEYRAYYAVLGEPDAEKRAAALFEFLARSPDSGFAARAGDDFLAALNSLYQDGKCETVFELGERWLRGSPADVRVSSFAGNAALQLGRHEECARRLEPVYAAEPAPPLARQILACHLEAGHREKTVEWAEKIFAMPEFAGDYALRYDLATRFYAARDLERAARYARLALEAIDRGPQSGGENAERTRNLVRVCHHIVAASLAEQGDHAAAVAEYEKALASEKYAEGFYGIGLSLDSAKDIEGALPYYAAAELMGGPIAPRAKERLEIVYRTLHNDSLVGIDKVYRKARSLLGETPE